MVRWSVRSLKKGRTFRYAFKSTRPLFNAAQLCLAMALTSLLLIWPRHRHQVLYKSRGLLWITPRSGGFNNQLITVYEAIRCAQKHRRTVVLPLIYENVRADTSKGEGPYPFEDYFNISALSSTVRFTTPAKLDRTGLPCHTILFTTSAHFKANARRIPRLLKQQYVKRYAVQLEYRDYITSNTHATCVDDSLCPVYEFRHPQEFGSYSMYHHTGQGYSVLRSSRLRHIRAALQPSDTVSLIAQNVLRHIGTQFNAMHIRRGDYSTKCSELPNICEQFGVNAFMQSTHSVLSKISDFQIPSLPLFISTTHPDECRQMFANTSLRLVFMDDLQLPPSAQWASDRIDIISYASQIVASFAEEFVGNRFSSFTTEINNMRLIKDLHTPLRFF